MRSPWWCCAAGGSGRAWGCTPAGSPGRRGHEPRGGEHPCRRRRLPAGGREGRRQLALPVQITSRQLALPGQTTSHQQHIEVNSSCMKERRAEVGTSACTPLPCRAHYLLCRSAGGTVCGRQLSTDPAMVRGRPAHSLKLQAGGIGPFLAATTFSPGAAVRRRPAAMQTAVLPSPRHASSLGLSLELEKGRKATEGLAGFRGARCSSRGSES